MRNRIKKQELDLRQREFRANVLYDLGRTIADAKTQMQIAAPAVTSIKKIFSLESAVLSLDEDGKLNRNPLYYANEYPNEKDFVVASWSLANKTKAGWGTQTLSSSRCLCLPLFGRSSVVGVIVLYPENRNLLNVEQENLIDTIASNLAIALEREMFESKAQNAKLLAESEKLHHQLLESS